MSSPDESGIGIVHDLREQVDPAMLTMLDDFKRKADA